MSKEFNIKNSFELRIRELTINIQKSKLQRKQLKKILKERKRNAKKKGKK